MNDQHALQHAGFMGHRFAVTGDDGDGGRRMVAHVNTALSARRHAKEAKRGRAFRLTKTGWEIIKPPSPRNT